MVRNIRVSGRNFKGDKTENFIRYRIRKPEDFDPKEFRILDIGREGRHKLVRGRLRTTGEFRTQSIIVQRGMGIKKSETRKIIRQVLRET